MVSRDITEKEQLKEENSELRDQLISEQACGEMIGSSPAMQPVYRVIRAIAPLESTILISGESGTACAVPESLRWAGSLHEKTHFNLPAAKSCA